MLKFLQKIIARSLFGLIIFNLTVTGANALDEAVTVSAVVGNLNAPAVIEVTDPVYLNTASNILYLGAGTSQTITFEVTDTDSTGLFYTITPSVGTTTIESEGPVNPTFERTFIYNAPASAPTPNAQTITIAVNDGSNVSSKVINLYIW